MFICPEVDFELNYFSKFYIDVKGNEPIYKNSLPFTSKVLFELIELHLTLKLSGFILTFWQMNTRSNIGIDITLPY